jgi:PIN domain nuclease of toxin-antitoxin system
LRLGSIRRVRLLRDTHISLCALLEPERLSQPVRAALVSPDSVLWLSPISVREATTLAERRRNAVAGDAHKWVRELLDALPRREAPLTFEMALVSRRLGWTQQDPADRLIATSAAVHDLVLITADECCLLLTATPCSQSADCGNLR